MRYTREVKKFLLAPLATVAIVASILGIGIALKPEPVQAAPVAAVAEKCKDILLGLPVGTICAEQDGKSVVVKLDNATLLTLPLSNIQLPPVTVRVPQTVRVTLPRVTVIRPPVTIRLPGVTLPGETVTVRLPGQTVAGKTTTVNLPGATETVTLAGSGGTTTFQNVTVRPQVVPVTVTQSNGQTIQTSVTITPSPQPGDVTIKPGPERRISVSVPQFVGISFGLLLLGLVLGLLAIYLAYAAGYKDSEAAERVSWKKFRDDLFGKKE